jgi:hypothetical protein
MGLLNLFSKPAEDKLVRLPSGSFTLNEHGRLMTSTLPRAFPEGRIREIGSQVLTAFNDARKAQIPLTELAINYATLKIVARELRGGAMIFIMPLKQ